MGLIRLPCEDMYLLSSQLVMCKKILRKFWPALRAIAKKIEPQVKKWFSYKTKKTCMLRRHFGRNNTQSSVIIIKLNRVKYKTLHRLTYFSIILFTIPSTWNQLQSRIYKYTHEFRRSM